jgi:hypothetical protein
MAVGLTTTITTPPSSGGDLIGDIKTYFVAGLTERGDTVNPIVCRSFAEFTDLTGVRVTYGSVYDDAQAFFGEAGQTPCRLVLARSVGGAAATGLLSLSDGSSVATLRINAKDAGAWSSNVTVEIVAGSVTNTFTLNIYYKGSLVEKYSNLANPAAAVSALLISGYVRGTDLGSATVAPGNNPAVLAPTALSAGTDDRGTVTAATHIASLNRITADFGPGVCAIPGQSYTTVATGLAAHAAANGRIALTHPDVGTSAAAASTAARSIRSTTGGERLAFLYPWIVVPDGAGGTRTIAPDGFAAGRRAATIDAVGSWQPPAGHYGGAKYAAGVELALTAAQLNSLTDDAVSPIRLSSTGPRIADWRSVSGDEVDYRFLSVMDQLNDIAFQCDQKLEPFEMLTVDGKGHTLTAIFNEMKSVVAPIAAAGGLFAKPDGTPPDPGYRIDVGPGVNSTTSLGLGQVRVAVAVRPPGVAELIRFFLTSVTLSADL